MQAQPLLAAALLALALLSPVLAPPRAMAQPNADEAELAEVFRLQAEMDKLAQKSAWGGVERRFLDIEALGHTPDREHMLLAAEASRQRGDVLSTLQRLLEAQSMQPDEAIQQRIDDIGDTFGRVQILGDDPLSIDQAPFRPDAAAAVRFASEQTQGSGTFDGFLPAGSYRFGDTRFEVATGQPVLVVGTDEPGLGDAGDLTLQGVTFARRASVGGEKLVLNGVGARSKMSITVYVGALYLTEPTTDASAAIRQDLPKRFVKEFVFRRVSRTATADHFQQAFDRMSLSAEVRDQVKDYLDLIEEVERGDQMQFDYVPGKGTSILIKGKKKATFEGKAFMWALFSVYLGEDPPTERLKKGLLGG